MKKAYLKHEHRKPHNIIGNSKLYANEGSLASGEIPSSVSFVPYSKISSHLSELKSQKEIPFLASNMSKQM